MTLSIFLNSLLFLGFFISTDILKNKFNLEVDNSRKITHILCTLGIITFPYTMNNKEIYIICTLFIIITFLTKKIGMFKSIHSVKRKTFGAEVMPLGVLLSAHQFLPADKFTFVYGTLICGFSDTMAEIIGRKYNFRPIYIFNQKKTLGGSIAFFLTTLIITYFFLIFTNNDIITFKILELSIFLTFLELIQPFGLDNITIPVFSDLVLNYLLLI